MRAVLYCRVSTVEQASNLSLPTQEAMCRAYCAREGYDVDRVFVDAGESARTAQRPEFQALIAHCRERKSLLHAVVVHSLTRFSRNTADHHAIAALLRGMGVALRSATEPIDDTPAGRFMEGVLSAAAQFDNDVRSSRVREGIRAAHDRGRWINAAPTGFQNRARLREGPSLVIDPVIGPLVRTAFELAASGQALSVVRRRLHAMGLTTPRTGRLISKQTFYELLRKRVYTGWMVVEGQEVRGDFEPLIDQETFAQVQRRLEAATRPRRPPAPAERDAAFPLRRFVRCAGCQRLLTGSWSTGRGGARHAYYHCVRGCVRTRKVPLEDAWIALLEAVRPSPGYLRALRTFVYDGWQATLEGARTHRQAVQKHIDSLEARLRRLDEAWLFERSIDEATYTEHRDRQRADLTLARLDLHAAQVEEIDVEGILDFAVHALSHSSRLWTAAPVAGRWDLQWGLFPSGVSWDGSTFSNRTTCLAYYQLQPPTADSPEWCATPDPLGTTGPAWIQIVAWLTHMDHLRRAA